MNPPAPVTHIFNFFSGQYGSVPYTPRNSYPAAAMVRDRRVALCRRRSRRRSGRSTAVPLAYAGDVGALYYHRLEDPFYVFK